MTKTRMGALFTLTATMVILAGAPRACEAQLPPGSAALRSGQASVQAGDRIVVKVYREAELSDTVLVPADGRLVLARIGTVDATHSTISALADSIRARYSRFLRNPSVSLVVLRRISVNGEVTKPDVYYVDVSMTLRDVIARAGGIVDTGDDSQVDIIRNGERIHVPNWQDDVSLASDLLSGDQIVVGKRSWLSRNLFSAVSSLALVASIVLSLRR
jgi:protein involved in polysaccharide export with SLBB domain